MLRKIWETKNSMKKANLKKVPITLIPILFIIIFLGVASFIPENSTPVTDARDYTIGQMIGILTAWCVVIDVIRFRKMKHKNEKEKN